MQRVYEENEWGKVSKRIVTVRMMLELMVLIMPWFKMTPVTFSLLMGRGIR